MGRLVSVLVVVFLSCQITTLAVLASTSLLASSFSEDNHDSSSAFFSVPSTPSSQAGSSVSDAVFPTNDVTPTTDESAMPTPTKTEITPSESPATMMPDNSSSSPTPSVSPASTISVTLPSDNTTITDFIPTVIMTTTPTETSSAVSTSTMGPTSSPTQLPESGSCVQVLGLSLGLSIPATAILTFIGTALLFMYCPKAKKNSPYVRMAPTVYFDEEEQD